MTESGKTTETNLIRDYYETPEERAAFECGYRLGRLHGEIAKSEEVKESNLFNDN